MASHRSALTFTAMHYTAALRRPLFSRYGLLVVLSLLVVILTIGFARIKQDDAFIYYTYARNLAGGRGYVFNPGERVNATTSPLYTLLLAALYAPLQFTSADLLPLIGHLVGALSLLGAAWCAARIYQRSAFPAVALAFPLLILASPLLPAGVGMETFLVMALLMAALLAYDRGSHRWAAAAAGLAVLARPDALLFAAVLAGVDLFVRRRLPPWSALVIFALPVAAWLIFSLSYFGDVLPTTLTAKIWQTQSGEFWGSGYLFLGGVGERWPIFALGGVAALYIALRARHWAGHLPSTILLLWGVSYLLVYGLVLNPPPYPWYYTALTLPLALSLALALQLVVSRLVSRRAAAVAAWAAVVVPIVAAAALAAWPIQGSYKHTSYREAALWLNEHMPDGSSLGTSEIGVLGYYYTRGAIVDGLGLVTPEGRAYVRQRDYTWYLRELQPDALVFHYPPWPYLEDVATEPWFQEAYEPGVTLGGPWPVVTYLRRDTLPNALATNEAE